MKSRNFLFVFWMLLVSCGAFSKSDNEEVIDQTIQSVISEISENNYVGVMGYFGADYLKEDTFKIRRDVLKAHYILSRYHGNNSKNLKWTASSKMDNLSRQRYDVAIFDGFDSTTGYMKVILQLYFGPTEIVPLGKLSGFDVEIEVDLKYRGELMDQGRLLDIQEVVDSLNKR